MTRALPQHTFAPTMLVAIRVQRRFWQQNNCIDSRAFLFVASISRMHSQAKDHATGWQQWKSPISDDSLMKNTIAWAVRILCRQPNQLDIWPSWNVVSRILLSPPEVAGKAWRIITISNTNWYRRKSMLDRRGKRQIYMSGYGVLLE